MNKLPGTSYGTGKRLVKAILDQNGKKLKFSNKEKGSLKKAKKQEGIAGVVM